VNIARRECIVIAFDRLSGNFPAELVQIGRKETVDLSEGWRIDHATFSKELKCLSSWTEWEGMEQYSGRVTYTRSFDLPEYASDGSIELDLGDVHEIVRLSVNGQEIGVRMWKPYAFKLNPELLHSINELRVEITNSLANRYDGLSLPSGLLGPITLTIGCHD